MLEGSWGIFGGAFLLMGSFNGGLGGILGGLGGILGPFGWGSWGILVLSLGDLGVILGVSWGILEVSWGYLGGSEVVDKMVEILMSPPMLTPKRISTNFQSQKTNSNKIGMLSSDLGACLSMGSFGRDLGGS